MLAMVGTAGDGQQWHDNGANDDDDGVDVVTVVAVCTILALIRGKEKLLKVSSFCLSRARISVLIIQERCTF